MMGFPCRCGLFLARELGMKPLVSGHRLLNEGHCDGYLGGPRLMVMTACGVPGALECASLNSRMLCDI